MAGSGPGGCGDDDVIVLDEEEQEEEGASAPPPAAPPPPAEGRALQSENEQLFAEFVALCTEHTREHPEVMPYLASRHQKTCPRFLASAEFRNVLGRCLSRVRAQRSKVYVYVSELCTVLKAHRRRQPGPEQPPPAPAGPPAQLSPPPGRGSSRQIRHLEGLLRVHAEEIRRLQAQELDLDELDSEDSAYLQEGRLKRRMMRIFRRLCELKDCSSLTGRVIEQRIPYRGTRYPEVNRRIERLINHPEAFPDYNDILKVVQKASTRHGLALPKQQMASMAASAFQEVGERLQERRRLDLVYNFGSYLTDEYRRENDPALTDDELARRLRHNREVAVQRLDQVLVRYVDLQDKNEEGEWRPGQARPGGATSPQQAQPTTPREPDSVVGAAAGESGSGPERTFRETSPPDHDEEEEEEEEEESSSSETDMEAELEKSLEGGEEEEEGGLAPDPGDPPAYETEADQHMGLKVPELLLDSSAEEELDEEEEEEDDDDDDDGSEEREDQGEVGKQPPLPEPRPPGNPPVLSSPPSQQFLLEIEAALPLEASETPPPSPPLLPPLSPRLTEQGGECPISLPKAQPPLKRSRSLENSGSCWPAPAVSCRVNGQPPSKRGRQELSVSKSYIEVPSGGSSEEEGCGKALLRPLSPHSPLPMADSTCADSPSPGLVTSTQGSPQAGQLVQICKASVATQCDPEEIIVLSDSD
ncbi:death domain-associated protein 6 isoform X2 [Tiliqua scincoides]|uniref:death domain-associated protein 6 isoform X2 n=1 Tax=Tiliqua scincoides TaxID=71010 RepID=UPI0034620570